MMTNPKPVVVVTRKLPEVVETRMMELFEAHLNRADAPMAAREVLRAVRAADVLVPTVTDRLDAKLIERLPDRVRLIANFGAGVDHIDVEAALDRGITVTNTPEVLTEDTADMAMALILAASRRLGEGERLARSGKWTGWAPTFMMGNRIWGKRLGIVGMGRIGTALARRARGFGIAVHYHNRQRVHADVEAALEATYWDSIDDMLGHMDIISINCPSTPETHHLLSATRLGLVRPHAVIVNTSRGTVIDEAALARLLASGAIAAAGLDVYENEPNFAAGLAALENVVLSPHIGSATREGRVAMGERVVINIKTFVDGHSPPDRVLSAATLDKHRRTAVA